MKLIYLEIKKLLKFPPYKYSLAFIITLTLAKSLIPLVIKSSDKFNWANSFIGTADLIFFFTNFCMIIIVSQFISSEYQNRTAQLSLSYGISRSSFILNKAVALVFGTYLFITLSFLVSFVSLAGVSLILGNFSLNDFNFMYFALALVLSPLKFFPIMFITYFLTICLRSSVFTIALSIAYILFGEFMLMYALASSPLYNFVECAPGRIGQAIDMNIVKKISNVTFDITSLDFGTSMLFVIGIILIYSISFIWLSVRVFKRQDLSR